MTCSIKSYLQDIEPVCYNNANQVENMSSFLNDPCYPTITKHEKILVVTKWIP